MTRRYFKRFWSKALSRNPIIPDDMYFVEYEFHNFIGDDDVERVGATRKTWRHGPGCDWGTAFEWVQDDFKEFVFSLKEAAEIESKIRNTKYMSRRIPEELKPWFRYST